MGYSRTRKIRTITKTYYKGAHGIILTYDVTGQNSFKNIRNWIKQIEANLLGVRTRVSSPRWKLQNNARFPCFSAIFFVSLHLVRPVLFAYKATPEAQSFMSFGGHCKIFARSPQDIAPPAATICHGRGKLATCRLAPCYIPSKSLFPRGLSPFLP